MDELINQVAQRTGLAPDKARALSGQGGGGGLAGGLGRAAESLGGMFGRK
jgi:hypothetical protein